MLYVANVDEDKVADPDSIDYVQQIREFAATENAEVVVISARAEEEISELDDEDRAEFLAPQAAGIIHSDFEKGFIRAVTMSYDDLIKYGSEKAVKEAGRLREEGKDYIVQDGDIMEFRFNV